MGDMADELIDSMYLEEDKQFLFCKDYLTEILSPRFKAGIWTTAKSTQIQFSAMTTGHIRNTLAKIKRGCMHPVYEEAVPYLISELRRRGVKC